MSLILILMTLPQYAAIIPLLPYTYQSNYATYANIILSSTTVSILWQASNEHYVFLMYFDYILAFLWFVYDIILSLDTNDSFQLVFSLNMVLFLLNILHSHTDNYILLHALWHCVSCIKAYTVSRLIVPLRHVSEFGTH